MLSASLPRLQTQHQNEAAPTKVTGAFYPTKTFENLETVAKGIESSKKKETI